MVARSPKPYQHQPGLATLADVPLNRQARCYISGRYMTLNVLRSIVLTRDWGDRDR
jgi:hypothetical protein